MQIYEGEKIYFMNCASIEDSLRSVVSLNYVLSVYGKEFEASVGGNATSEKGTFGHVRLAKIQINLRIHTVWSESSPGVFWIATHAKIIHANKESDQTVRMRRLIKVMVGCTWQEVHVLTLRLTYVRINPYIPSGFSNLSFLDRSISSRRCVWVVFIITMFYRNSCI